MFNLLIGLFIAATALVWIIGLDQEPWWGWLTLLPFVIGWLYHNLYNPFLIPAAYGELYYQIRKRWLLLKRNLAESRGVRFNHRR